VVFTANDGLLRPRGRILTDDRGPARSGIIKGCLRAEEMPARFVDAGVAGIIRGRTTGGRVLGYRARNR